MGKLIVFYDDNGISIDGEVEEWFADDTEKRFQAYNWQTLSADGHDPDSVIAAIEKARANTKQPTIISCKTQIGYGSPNKAGTAATHGAPLGEDEIQATREALGGSIHPSRFPNKFTRPWEAREKGYAAETAWKELFTRYEEEYPVQAFELIRRVKGEFHADFESYAHAYIAECNEKGESLATRKASQNAIGAFGEFLPELIGGSADLTGSNLTKWGGSQPISAMARGNYIFTGTRIRYGRHQQRYCSTVASFPTAALS